MFNIESTYPEHALVQGLNLLLTHGDYEESRNGRVVVMPAPVVTANLNPTRRVMFSPTRDCNPFFHLYESIWMLAGSNNVQNLAALVARMAEFSDDGKTLSGAYGHRWRNHFSVDQIPIIINELKRDPNSRRCVIGMWDPDYDLGKLQTGGKDLPCNTQIYFRIRKSLEGPELDMTVTCRSNDAVWGAHGANVVHFSVLHEFIAEAVGVGIGCMFQLSNNYHLYIDRPDCQKLIGSNQVSDNLLKDALITEVEDNPPERVLQPNESWEEFLDECKKFVTHPVLHSGALAGKSSFLFDTVQPAMISYSHHKKGSSSKALAYANSIVCPHWNKACTEWLQRRYNKDQA